MDPKKLILSTAYDTDKIVFTKEQTGVLLSGLPTHYESGDFIIKRLSFPHGMPQPVFIDFRFKVNPATTWRTGGSGETSMGYSDATNIHLLFRGSKAYMGDTTVDYSLFGSWIPEYSSTKHFINPLTTSSKTYFDSRLNYRKIAKQGVISLTGNGNIPHGLSFMPTYVAYFESFPNQVWQEHAGGIKNPWVYDSNMAELASYATATTIEFELGKAASDTVSRRIWYKVYADG